VTPGLQVELIPGDDNGWATVTEVRTCDGVCCPACDSPGHTPTTDPAPTVCVALVVESIPPVATERPIPLGEVHHGALDLVRTRAASPARPASSGGGVAGEIAAALRLAAAAVERAGLDPNLPDPSVTLYLSVQGLDRDRGPARAEQVTRITTALGGATSYRDEGTWWTLRGVATVGPVTVRVSGDVPPPPADAADAAGATGGEADQ
jgi:hypothetical protein